MPNVRYDYWPRYGPENYSVLLPFERNFSSRSSTEWMLRNWHHSITISLVYVALIVAGRRFMRERVAFDLQRPLLVWNGALALFSLIGALRNGPELLWALREHGFLYSICEASFAQGVTGFWTQAFAFSKVVELLDTAFIVARKRPLTFLHAYHHCSVLVYTWHAYKEHTASGRWFIFMNYTVHALMYTYYALMTTKWLNIPRRFSMFVTLCQLSQMTMGVWIGITVWRLRGAERAACQQTPENLYLTFAIYASYFVLFSNFFLQAYCRTKRTKSGMVSVYSKIREEDIAYQKIPNGTSHHSANEMSAANAYSTHSKADINNNDARKSPPLTRLRHRMQQGQPQNGTGGNGTAMKRG